MAVKASGAISFATDIVGEFGGTAPYAMSDYYRGGSKVPNITDNNSIGASGLIRFGGFYSALNEILQALTGTNISLSSIFGSDWTATTPKRATIASGVTIGGTGGTAAITIESTMGGTITIVITGSVLGTGGSAGGSGGHAILCSVSGVTLEVESGGLLAGGGGGGGAGGSGGNGSYSSSSTTGQSWTNFRFWRIEGYYGGQAGFDGYNFGVTQNQTSKSAGSAVYYRGNYRQSMDGVQYYNIYRTLTTTTNTNGGAGGAGGFGQGYNQTNASGSAGSSGGTNAGAGGTGGSGGTYGLAGSTGGTGANGNSSNGSSGSSGGAAGAALSGTALSSYTNNGTVNGTVST